MPGKNGVIEIGVLLLANDPAADIAQHIQGGVAHIGCAVLANGVTMNITEFSQLLFRTMVFEAEFLEQRIQPEFNLHDPVFPR